MNKYLNAISKFRQLPNEQSLKCGKCITKKLFEALKSMPNYKSGNEALLKNFSKHFGLKKNIYFYVFYTLLVKRNSAPHKGNYIIIRKKDKDKRLIKIWRPISLINVDIKIITKALSQISQECSFVTYFR